MKKLFFLMNPRAGKQKANKLLPDILALYNRHGYEVTVHMTAGPGDGMAVCQQKAPETDLIVAAGGDGTLNEAMTGILRSGASVPLGYIPCGSTNDFANSLGLPTDILAAAKLTVEGAPVAYDVGKFQDRVFSYVASFGAFTKASYATSQSVKNMLGHLAYVLAGAKEIFHIPKEHVSFHTDAGDFEGDYIFGAVSNSTSVGGILTLSREIVDMRDGVFELMLVRPPKNAGELTRLVADLKACRYDSPMLTFRAVRSLQVTARADMPWSLDGEKHDGCPEIHIENLHEAIRLVSPHE